MSANPVVADVGPLHYLVLIDCAKILPELFGHVCVPIAVRDELTHPRAPQKVKDWILSPPPWIEIAPVAQPHAVHGLHKGESEALQLALERKVKAVLMDDMDGRAAARRLGIATVFTVAVLELAAEKNLIDLSSVLTRLQQTSFFISKEIIEAALERDRLRQQRKEEL